MADERAREPRGTGDAPRDLDGMGREAAHGGGEAAGAAQGGSVGRRTMGNAGDDLLGIDAQGQGGSAGGDGGGSSALYSGESSYAGQAGGRDSSQRGAYADDAFGRQGEDAEASRDTSGGTADPATGPIDPDVSPDVGRRDPTR